MLRGRTALRRLARLNRLLSRLSRFESPTSARKGFGSQGADRFRTARRNLVLLAAQCEAPDSQATQPRQSRQNEPIWHGNAKRLFADWMPYSRSKPTSVRPHIKK